MTLPELASQTRSDFRQRFGQIPQWTVAAPGRVNIIGEFTDLAGGLVLPVALDSDRGRTPDALPGMMTADDVAEVVLFVLTRPRSHRILETAFRPMTEASWG